MNVYELAGKMSRPKKITDAAVLAAVGAVLQEQGPAGLTFATAAAATGLSAAALVQRYGSKDALLQAALLYMWDRLDDATAAEDERQELTPQGAVALLLRLSSDYGSGDDAAQGLLLLREDFRDPALRARGAAWHAVLSAALGRRLAAEPERQARLGRLLASQWQGAVLWWGFSRAGSLRSHLRRELRDWLAGLSPDRHN